MSSKMIASWCLQVSLFALIASVDACVSLMGDAKNSLVASTNATRWDYGFRGDDWVGKDVAGAPWVCKSGKKQSPINLLDSMHHSSCGAKRGNNKLKTKWTYSAMKSNGSNIVVFNNGHTIQVQWDAGVLSSKVLVQADGNNVGDLMKLNNAYDAAHKNKKVKAPKPTAVPATPIQFHFHTVSEHAVNGHFFPLELHIVHVIPQSVLPRCPPSGCLTVTGVMFKLDDHNRPNKALDAVFKAMPLREGVKAALPAGSVLDLQALLPQSKSYMLYEGSLTTPPCSEGVLWHVFDTPLSISQEQYDAYAKAVGLKECKLKNPAASASSTTAGRRALAAADVLSIDGVVSLEHPVLTKLSAFRRGSYSGFVDAEELRSAVSAAPGNARRMLGEGGVAADGSDDWDCKIVSYGFTNRNCQKLNGRTVLAFA